MKFSGGTDASLAEPAIRITPRGTRGVRIPRRGPVPGLFNYQQKTDREIPIVRLSQEP